MSDVPVIFLAFANDPSRPLETLDRERKSIQRALEPLTANRRWELRVEPNATLDDITQIFQSAEFRNRVAIFHYAGHAADDALSLATDTGTNAPARSSGLARFLAEQRGLELVVLNGCRTRGQATSLLDAGVSHVVATSVSIDDAAATQFATGFYRGLAGGATLASSFREALAILETSGVPRSAARSVPSHRGSAVEEAPLSSESTWWELYPGESAANAWTLAEVERDPYFGLPPLEDAPLPAAPFVEYLARFERRHAAIFFGRGDEVRSLYRALTDKNTPAIHLLYGQSGVGKSSLLEAGLLPRLGAGSDAHEVVYCRRRADLGCLGTVLDVIPASSEAKAKAKAKDLHAAWLERESASSRPITIIIDQVEEAFTAPRAAGGAAELLELLEAVAGTFSGGNTNTRPRGKLVLGFRKEWLAEIVGRLKDAQVPYSATFVEPLKAQGIIEAIEGPSRSQRLRSFYNLSVAPGLASIIAEDLREDQGSPIAPVLQILLWRMWNAAKRASEGAPTFDTATYQELRKNGLLLDDFFSGQVAAIDQWKPELVQSGFVLDYLREHTTDLGTAAERTTAQLAELYPHRAPELDEIRERMVGTYHLLVEPPGESRESSARATRLSHDTLAPLVRQRFDASTAPGQRARRLLENRQADWGGGRSTGEVKAAELEKPREDQMASAVLDDLDLTQVERGQAGMRGWTKSERRLVEASRAARAVRQKRQRQIRILGSIAAVLILAFGIGMWAQYREARRSAQEASARSLLAEARNVVRDDIGGALLLAVAAMQEGGSWLEFQNGLRSILEQARSIERILPPRRPNSAVFSHDGRRMAESDAAGILISDSLGVPRDTIRPGREGEQGEVAFSPDDQRIALGRENAIVSYAVGGSHAADTLHVFEPGERFQGFSPDRKSIAVVRDSSASVYDIWTSGAATNGRYRARQAFDLPLSTAAGKLFRSASTNGRHLLIMNMCRLVRPGIPCAEYELWDLAEHRLVLPSQALDGASKITFSSDRRHALIVYTRSSDYKNYRFDLVDLERREIVGRGTPVVSPTSVAFADDGTVATTDRSSVGFWRVSVSGYFVKYDSVPLPPGYGDARFIGDEMPLLVAPRISRSLYHKPYVLRSRQLNAVERLRRGDFGKNCGAGQETGMDIPSVALSGDARSVAVGWRPGCIVVRDFQTGREIRRLNDYEGLPYLRFALSNDGSKLIATLDTSLAIWDLTDIAAKPRLAKIGIPDASIGRAFISNDGKHVAIAGAFDNYSRVQLLATTENRTMTFPGSESPTGAAFGDGDTLFVSTDSGNVLAWTLGDGRIHTVVHLTSDLPWSLKRVTGKSIVVEVVDNVKKRGEIAVVPRDSRARSAAIPRSVLGGLANTGFRSVGMTKDEGALIAVAEDLSEYARTTLGSRGLREEACSLVGWNAARETWDALKQFAAFPCKPATQRK